MRKQLFRIGAAIGRALCSRSAVVVYVGLWAGMSLLAVFHLFFGHFGTSPASIAAVLIACGLGYQNGSASLGRVDRFPRQWMVGGLLFLLGMWTAAFAWLVEFAASVLGRIPVETLSRPLMPLCVLTAITSVLFVLPLFWFGRIPGLFALDRNRTGIANKDSDGTWPMFTVGTAIGAMLAATVIAPNWGVTVVICIASLSAVAASIGVLVHWAVRRRQGLIESARSSAAESPTIHLAPSRYDRLVQTVAVASIGVLFAAVGRVVYQLVPGSAYLVVIEWSALLFGGGVGMWWRYRRSTGRVGIRAGLSAFVWTVFLLAVFPWLVSAGVEIKSTVTSAAWMMSIRALFVFLAVTPLGLAWGGVQSAMTTGGRVFVRVQMIALIAGYLVSRTWLIPQWTTPTTILVAGCILAAVTVVHWFRYGRPVPKSRLSRIATVTMLAIVCSSPMMARRYQPAKSARLLFSTNVMIANKRGVEAESLTVLDEGRHVATIESVQTTYTLWKYRGSQYQFRDNGVPRAFVSTDTNLCPHYAPELLQTVLPLTLHERPHRVLLLGTGGGVPVPTALNFPVMELTCVEDDSALLQLTITEYWAHLDEVPQQDERFQLLKIDPALAVTSKMGEYDVVLSCPEPSPLGRATAEYTTEYYHRVARHLHEDGLFCQRFQAIDYGPMVICSIGSTLDEVFEYAAIVEVAPGELLLLGTNSKKGLTRSGLVERLQKEHVRRSLAQVGWDWSVPLNLPVYFCDRLTSRENKLDGAPNHVRTGHFAFTLPTELMRWGPKRKETYEQLGPLSTRVLAWPSVDGNDPEVLNRLAEVAGQRQLMTAYPDQPWAYRKTLKDRLLNHARPAIQPVSASSSTKRMHPADEFRKEYFQALGRAARGNSPPLETVRELERFTQQYDPLMSYFAHHELAALYARAEPRDVQTELAHRLHAVHFADGGDRSVRDVIAAIELLCDEADAEPDAVRRFDHLNALLQVLQTRWELRGAVKPRSPRIVLNDIEMSLTAIDSALELMSDLRSSAGVSEDFWTARERRLHRSLVRPLRSYRSKLRPHHLKEVRNAEKNGEAPSEN